MSKHDTEIKQNLTLFSNKVLKKAKSEENLNFPDDPFFGKEICIDKDTLFRPTARKKKIVN